MKRKLIFISVLVAVAAFALSAQAGVVTFNHGLPALPGAVPSNNPVDIAIDGVCENIYVPYGSKLGPTQFEAGLHSVIFYESVPGDPCRGTVLSAREWNVEDTTQIDVALSLNAEDQVTVSVWDNTTSLFAVENGAETAVEVRHAAGGPILDVVLEKDNEVVQVGGVPAGLIFGPIETTQGAHILRIRNGKEVLDQDTDSLKPNRVYWAYVTGSVFKKTVNILTIESIPGDEIEGGVPSPPRFSTCCFFGTAIQLGQNQCQSTGGTYIGDVDPATGPCQGIPWWQ
jgi:hypothetical protein